jgi:sugar/nucleoside kinase (ribokinase family)
MKRCVFAEHEYETCGELITADDLCQIIHSYFDIILVCKPSTEGCILCKRKGGLHVETKMHLNGGLYSINLFLVI